MVCIGNQLIPSPRPDASDATDNDVEITSDVIPLDGLPSFARKFVEMLRAKVVYNNVQYPTPFSIMLLISLVTLNRIVRLISNICQF